MMSRDGRAGIDDVGNIVLSSQKDTTGKHSIVRDTTSSSRIVAGQMCNVTRVDNYVTHPPDCDSSTMKIG